MIQHLYTRSFMLMILGSLLSFGWVMAQEEPPDEPDEAIVPVFDLTDESQPPEPMSQVPVFDLRPLTSTAPLTSTWTVLFADDFETGGRLLWGWPLPLLEQADNHVLHYSGWQDPLLLEIGNLADFRVQMKLKPQQGEAMIGLRHSGSGAYWLTIQTDGRLSLSRGEQVLQEVQVARFDLSRWSDVAVTVRGEQVQVWVDGGLMFHLVDADPLPSGMIWMGGGFGSAYVLDDFVLSVPAEDVSGYTAPQADAANSLQLSVEPAVLPAASDNEIAFRRRMSEYGYAIYTVKADGSNLRWLVGTNSLYLRPEWSPDGRWIAYDATVAGNREIYVIPSGGGVARQLTQNLARDEEAAWSPDGGKIAFLSNRDRGRHSESLDIYTMQADGSDVRRVTSSGWIRDVDWSADGRFLVYARCIGCGGRRLVNVTELFKYDWQTGTTQRLTVSDQLEHYRGPRFPNSPSWSPAAQIVFSAQPYPSNRHAHQIYRMNPDGTQVVRLTTSADYDSSPEWSADGGQIVFVRGGKLHIMQANGSRVRRIPVAAGGYGDTLPSWKPAGPVPTIMPTPTATPTDTPRGGLCSSVLLSNVDDMLCAAPPTTCNGTLIAANLYYLDRPNGRLLGIMAVDAGTGIEALYRDNSGEWHAIRFRYQGQQYAGWVTATHPEWIRFANAQGQACRLEVHPDYRPTPTPTATPTPTSTPTPTATPTPLPVRLDVPTEALPFHRLARQIGLPLPFDRLPVAAADYNWAQGYGANAFAYDHQTTYSGTHGIHTGLDYGWSLSQGSSRARPIYALCDGVVRNGRTGGGGGTTASGLGITLRCFADDPPDPDGDGKPNLSNLILSYNHVATKSVSVGACVSTGTVLGTAGTGTDPHLHLEMFLYEGFTGNDALRLNPLLMFDKATVAAHMFGRYFPDEESQRQKDAAAAYGLRVGDITAWSLLGDVVGGSEQMFSIQDPNTPGPDWPANTFPNLIPTFKSRGYTTGGAPYIGSDHTCTSS